MPTNAGRPEIETAQVTNAAAETLTVGASATYYEVDFDAEGFAHEMTTDVTNKGIKVVKGAKYLVEVDIEILLATAADDCSFRVALSDDTVQVALKAQNIGTSAESYKDEAIFTATASGTVQLQIAEDNSDNNFTVSAYPKMRLTRVD